MFVIATLFVGLIVSLGQSFPENDIPNVEPEYLDMLLKTNQYELFSKLMQIDDVDLVRPNEKERSDNPMFNKGLEFGDILVSKKQKEEARQAIRFDIYGGSKWPNRNVPYVISNEFSWSERRTIRRGIKVWNEKVDCIKFNPRGNENDYVFIFPGNGCYSYLGRIGGQQALSLQKNGCVYQGTILHEMDHAIGFAHEQNRYDRDNYIKMLWENIPEQWKSQYEKTNPRDFNLVSDYDYYSIMHYGIIAPESNNKPAFEIYQEGIDESKVGNGNNFTPTDLEKIKLQYC